MASATLSSSQSEGVFAICAALGIGIALGVAGTLTWVDQRSEGFEWSSLIVAGAARVFYFGLAGLLGGALLWGIVYGLSAATGLGSGR